MFLFLSKLLPLFIYPLGIACVLMIVALVLLWKRPRWAAVPIVLALIALLVGSNGWVENSLLRSLEWQNLPPSELPTAEAIVILGGATKSALPPRPSVDLSEEGDRVFYGAQLYREGKAPLVIASGGRIDWRGSGAPESADMAV
ncbi:YdcF family protein, partial [Coleofasciculus sp. FACHB-712]|nr:YdcF family protein [Coleofasciculus sp. FACHB-712]